MGNINFFQGLTDLFNGKDKEIDEIKKRIAEFFNMKNIHFLFGSGTSCKAIPNMKGLFSEVKTHITSLTGYENESIKNEFDGICQRPNVKENLEEILGILYSHRVYLQSYTEGEQNLKTCEELIGIIEKIIFDKINTDFSKAETIKVLEIYRDFYRKIALRNKDLSRINIFTTNNDLFNETALDSLNIHYINGFSGGLSKFFNPALFNYTFSKRMDTSIEKFEPVENMIYLYKLHGSINWIEDEKNMNTFFKIKEILNPIKGDENILIYPTPTKQDKSLGSPYVELFREFQKKLLEPHSVLFIIGYSFSDEHVNNIIYQALAVNSTINVIIINNVEDKPIAKIDDNRIFRIFGETDNANSSESNKEESSSSSTETIHFFNYIVNSLLPNIDAFKHKDNSIENFIKSYNENLLK